MKKSVSSIELHGLELNVNLGWTEKERAEKQLVILDFKIQFSETPRACETDSLHDTYCYDRLIKTLEKSLAEQSFKLIERLGHLIYQLIKVQTPSALIAIRLTKKPAIPKLKGGVSFCVGDEGHTW